MLNTLAVICFIGAGIRMLFYRLTGNRKITMSYLQGKEKEQQLISLITGIGFILFFAFVLSAML